MFSQVLKFFTVFLMAFAASYAHAGEEKKEEKKEEGKKEGEAGKEEKKEVKSSEDSYSVVAARVAALEAKVKSGQEEIEKLIEEKQSTKDPAKVSEIVKQMLGIHKELQKNVKDYDQQRALLKYRYPEKGLTGEREYERIDVKSIEDMESQMSLTTSVNRTLKKVRSQYDTPEDVKARAEKSAEEANKKSSPSTPSLTEPVVLKK
ncbi:MAG TPA: hypothetical protein VF412_03940 [Bdellovibrio sp.]|uniref:hypothetical protein n=1 Tax=Bdellovibrio sp. TaxID=28201 RepID=UPI002F099DC1